MTTSQETDGLPRVSGALDEAPDGTPDDALAMNRGKRLAISGLIVLILVGVFASTMPKSQIKDDLLDVARPFLTVTGLDQGWGVFAPSPPRSSNVLSARVDRADGTVGVYPFQGGDGLTEYWDYRWRKYGEQLWKKRGAERERTAFAGWIADQDRAAGHEPVRVTLVRSSTVNLPPDPGNPDVRPVRDIPFFTTPVSRR